MLIRTKLFAIVMQMQMSSFVFNVIPQTSYFVAREIEKPHTIFDQCTLVTLGKGQNQIAAIRSKWETDQNYWSNVLSRPASENSNKSFHGEFKRALCQTERSPFWGDWHSCAGSCRVSTYKTTHKLVSLPPERWGLLDIWMLFWNLANTFNLGPLHSRVWENVSD